MRKFNNLRHEHPLSERDPRSLIPTEQMIQMKKWTWPLLATFSMACGSDGENLAWEPETIVFHDPDGMRTEVVVDGDCAEYNSDVCFNPSEDCEGGDAAEVYVDESGEVLEVICFPAAEEGNADVIVAEGGQTEVALGNNDVLVLGTSDDEPAFVGDLELDSNNVTIWGDDPATSVLDGNLSITKNNALISGITITGDVIVTFNDARFSNCVIKGNLVLQGNNAKVAGCVVEGDVVVEGNNSAFTLTDIKGEFSDGGMNTTCEESSQLLDDEPVALDCEAPAD